ncbi:MAG: type II toxin-antitoxin system RelE/ParE family toxin [Limisphaerales bacterium]
MAPRTLHVHPAFYRRLRHYRDRIGIVDGRPKVAERFALATRELINLLLENPQRGHSARFEAPELTDIQRMSVPGFPVFSVFYRWSEDAVTLITIEHSKQDLPSRLASIVTG